MRRAAFLAVVALFAFWGEAAFAARTITAAQTSPAAGAKVAMGSTQSVTLNVTNTASGANAAEHVYTCRFRLNNGSTFSSATAAPAGWTRTAYSTTSVTFQASSWANTFASGSSMAFTVVIVMTTAATDTAQTLRDVRCSFTTTNPGPPFGNLGNSPLVVAGSWTIVCLSITSFIITDTSGTAITSLVSGNSFKLVMTVKNVSSATQNNVVSNTNPPTATKTGTVTQGLTSTVGSPLSLTAGSSGTITFTFSTAAADSGTIFFTANAQNGATVTSTSATSPTLAVGRFTASLSVSPTCQYVGSNITVTMTLTNQTASAITSITPTLTPVAGAPVTAVSGPTPATIASLAAGANTTVTWTYSINAVGATNPFTFSGSATGTGGTTPTATSSNVTRGDFTGTISPTVVNASSTNVEMTVTITNNGCAAVNSVAITLPAGWTASGDTYSLVNLVAGPVETWTAAGTTFTSPNAANQMPTTYTGNFDIVASTPSAAGANTFTARVTDANGLFTDVSLAVTVNAYLAGTVNAAKQRGWREDFR